MLERIVGIFRKGKQEPRGELFELAASGESIFTQKTEDFLIARGGIKKLKACEAAVREALTIAIGNSSGSQC